MTIFVIAAVLLIKHKENLMYRDSENILTGFRNEKTTNTIDKVKYTFNSLIPTLHDLVVQKIIREVDSSDLAKALKKCDESVKEKIFRNITRRHRENIGENRAYYGLVDITDIEESQEKIMKTIHRLEENGEIIIKIFEHESYE